MRDVSVDVNSGNNGHNPGVAIEAGLTVDQERVYRHWLEFVRLRGYGSVAIEYIQESPHYLVVQFRVKLVR